MEEWFVVKTKPKQEQRALANLEHQGMEAFLPKLSQQRVQRGKRKVVLEPMFPGYLFVQLPNFDEQFYKIKNTFGVASLVRFGDHTPTIPDSWVQQLKATTTERDDFAPKVGDTVEIEQGPFAGLSAKIVGLDGESRCMVLLEFLQKQVTASFAYTDIRKP
ncbi:transcription/translation regulatory transformer protein RfaH [Idiomarina tyrosinivorans]|uniref:Transcription/translation regulatory transformer protein RfaH n=1 Tax=Idiomarina tyrosinivorans TaxID=1445662 RepID=A0A432ZQU9_9GAMM|nr:transcription/translation regulatory transformer protein RfaH [Idiomarina tyrosinivorans]RUO80280.1 transcription/translation regulatory transformer protein RfaH [Idiomarina tyrosinivorans]